MSTPTLKHVFNMAITPKEPINAGETPRGKTNWVEITDGKITGVNDEPVADVLSGGGDYFTRYVDENVIEIDLKLIAKDEAGDVLRFSISGFDYLDRATMLALDGRPGEESNASSPYPETFGLELLKCNTASAKYRWLNFAVLLGRVHFVVGAAGIESVVYKIYQITN